MSEPRKTCGGTGEGLSPLASSLQRALNHDWTQHQWSAMVLEAVTELLHHARQQAQREERERLRQEIEQRVNSMIGAGEAYLFDPLPDILFSPPKAHVKFGVRAIAELRSTLLALFNEGSDTP